jgi:outer membrane protein TolC
MLLLLGCAKYQPKALPTAPDLAAAPALTAPASQFNLPGLPAHLVPTDGLDEISVITLAVFNNPDLKAARLQAGVADAQLLQAGLLPDPQIGLGGATSVLNYGYAASFMEDITAIFLRGSAKAVARAHQSQVNLNILWQEWQVAEQARELFVQAQADTKIERLLTANTSLLAARCHQDKIALRDGNTTLPVVSADVSALADADAALRQQQLKDSTTRGTLNQLLGLKTNVVLKLKGPSEVRPLSESELDAAIAQLPQHRVDLVALQAGYRSQEEAVRRSILMQFPSVSAGFEEARDPVEGVNSSGANVNLTLPLFNRNRGQIAIANATREVLRQTYQAQLDAADSQSRQVWRTTQILARELRDLDARLPTIEKTAAAAEKSYAQGNLSADVYVSVETSLAAQRLSEARLRASLDQAQAALATLLGLPFAAP